MKWILSLLYAMLVVWTGLWRGIEANAYKPNSLWFCLVMGIACIAGAFFLRRNWRWVGLTLGIGAGTIVFLYYLYSFIVQPEKDATVRVGIIIVGSLGYLSVMLLPPSLDPEK